MDKTWNIHCHSVQNVLPSHLLSKNLEIEVYKFVTLLDVKLGLSH
jgi:hypothetical protein